jgi:hypothetical protein
MAPVQVLNKPAFEFFAHFLASRHGGFAVYSHFSVDLADLKSEFTIGLESDRYFSIR